MENFLNLIPTAIVLFAGVGGCSAGMTGLFKTLIAIDWDDVCQRNFELNFKNDKYIPFLKANLWTMTALEILQRTLLAVGELACLVCTCPCQGFSVASGEFDPLDPRNGLFLKTLDLIKGIAPKTFILENVPGMDSPQLIPIFNEIKLRFKEVLPNYRVKCFCVNCLFFGVPSSRERYIFIGIREDVFKFEPKLVAATPDIERFSIANVAPAIKEVSFGQSKKIIRLVDEYMPTITASQGGIRIFEDGVWTSLAEREDYLKLFSSFPADFVLDGSPEQKHHLIGNAVPPMLMYHLANYIRTQILGYPPVNALLPHNPLLVAA